MISKGGMRFVCNLMKDLMNNLGKETIQKVYIKWSINTGTLSVILEHIVDITLCIQN